MTLALDALSGRRLLLLNWRDLSHPRAGGAEVYCQQIGRRFAAAGADVTLLTSRFPGAPLAELVDGVRVLRTGSTYGVYPAAARHLRAHRDHYDAVVDFQNGIPFFAPLFVSRRTAVVCVVHHVHQDQFALHYPWPVSRVGQLLEGPVSRAVYADRPVVAVSPSTRWGVRRRLKLRGPVHVVPNGLELPAAAPERARTPEPSLVVVSRLVAHKRMDLLVRAVADLRRRGFPTLTLDLAGDGPDRPRLERLVQELGLGGVVTVHGFVDDAARDRLMAGAWSTASPSQAEGWGLTVLEAAAAGVPAVAFAVPGLRDSILDGVTGWLVAPDGRLADGIARALRQLAAPGEAEAVSARCRSWAGRFSWDASAERLAAVVAGEVARAAMPAGTSRTPSDLSVLVELQREDLPGVVDRLAGELRITDLWTVRPDGARLMLHGCDESQAVGVLRRMGVREPRPMTLVTAADLLVGPR